MKCTCSDSPDCPLQTHLLEIYGQATVAVCPMSSSVARLRVVTVRGDPVRWSAHRVTALPCRPLHLLRSQHKGSTPGDSF